MARRRRRGPAPDAPRPPRAPAGVAHPLHRPRGGVGPENAVLPGLQAADPQADVPVPVLRRLARLGRAVGESWIRRHSTALVGRSLGSR